MALKEHHGILFNFGNIKCFLLDTLYITKIYHPGTWEPYFSTRLIQLNIIPTDTTTPFIVNSTSELSNSLSKMRAGFDYIFHSIFFKVYYQFSLSLHTYRHYNALPRQFLNHNFRMKFWHLRN